MSEMHPLKHDSGGGSAFEGVIGEVWKSENAVVVYNRKTGWYDCFTFGIYPDPILEVIGVYKGNINNFKKNDRVLVYLKENVSFPQRLSLRLGLVLSTFNNIEKLEKIIN